MFTVTVSDHIMVAHSLHGDVFGPSQRLHGATYVVEASFTGEHLDDNGILIDIAAAGDSLRAVLDELDRQNLDEHPAFTEVNSTTEVLARHIADRLARAAGRGSLGSGAHRLTGLAVTLHESPTAWARFERPLAPS